MLVISYKMYERTYTTQRRTLNFDMHSSKTYGALLTDIPTLSSSPATDLCKIKQEVFLALMLFLLLLTEPYCDACDSHCHVRRSCNSIVAFCFTQCCCWRYWNKSSLASTKVKEYQVFNGSITIITIMLH